MSTSYNVHNDMHHALQAGRTDILAPTTANGTITVGSVQYGIVRLTAAGSPSFESAANVPVGTQVLVLTQAAVTIEGVTLADGEFALFMVSEDSSAAREWVAIANSGSGGAAVSVGDDVNINLGDADDAALQWSTNDASNHAFVIAGGDTNKAIHMCGKGDIDTDWALTADTHTTLYLHSDTTAVSNYMALGAHDSTSCLINNGGGTTLLLQIAGTTVVDIQAASVAIDDDIFYTVGTGDDAQVGWSTGDTDNHTLVIGLGDANQSLHITDKGAIATDWNVAAETHPTIYIHSNTTPTTDYLRIGAHDGGAALVDVVGGTAFDFYFSGTRALRAQSTQLTFEDGINIAVDTTTGTKVGTAASQKLGFWNATPVVQPADALQAALTNSTGGAQDGTLAACGDTSTSNQASVINNNFTDVHTLLNEIRDALVDTGLMKGAA